MCKEIGLTVPEVAKRFNKTDAIIEAWERGEEATTFRQLVELANYYKRSVATFFLPSIPPGTPKPHDYRMLPGVTPGEYLKETLIAYREIYNMLAEARELFNELDADIVFSLPTWMTHDAPEEKAEQLRSLLGVSVERQIKEFDTLIKSHGVLV